MARYEGYCIGGSNHGKLVAHSDYYLRLPVISEVSARVPDISEVPDMMETYSVEEYIWSGMMFDSGPVQFWRHSSLKTRRQVILLLVEAIRAE